MESAVCNVPSDSVDATIRGKNDEEGEPSIKDQEVPLHKTKIEVGEESPTNTQQPAEFIVHEAASTGNCWGSIQWAGDAATQEIKGELSNTGEQDLLNEKKVELGERLTVHHTQPSFETMVANEIASIRKCWNFMCSEKPEAGETPLDKESQDLNCKTLYGTSNREPEGLKMGMMREHEDEVLVTQEDSGESDQELEFPSSTAMNGVSQTRSPGRSVVKTKKRSLSDDGQASEPAERVEYPQKNPNPCASTEPGESFTDSPYLPESQNAGKSDYDFWFQSYQTSCVAAVHAAREASNFNESLEEVSDSPAPAQPHKAPTGVVTSLRKECKIPFSGPTHQCNDSHWSPTPTGAVTSFCEACKIPFSGPTHQCNDSHKAPAVTNTYECPECKKSFLKAFSLKHHRRMVHQGPKAYQCTKCPADFSSATQLMIHQCSVHNMQRQFNCPDCTKTYFTTAMLRRHRHIHTREVRQREASKLSESLEEVHDSPAPAQHYKAPTGVVTSLRKECKIPFSGPSHPCNDSHWSPTPTGAVTSLHEERKIPFSDPTHQCNDSHWSPTPTGAVTSLRKECKIPFSGPSHPCNDSHWSPTPTGAVTSLHEERKIPFSDPTHQCNDSHWSPTTGAMTSLRKEHKIPLSGPSHQCNDSHWVPTPTGAVTSLREEHKIPFSDPTHQCNDSHWSPTPTGAMTSLRKECKIPFSGPSLQCNDSHRAPTVKRTYECPECKKTFLRARSMYQHRRMVHHGPEVYQCSRCPAHFSLAAQLMHHECDFHNMERRYSCPYCSETFITITKLNKHRHTHTGEVRHECTECDKSFKKESGLHRHMRIHKWETPFKCTQCKACYQKKRNLKKHQKKSH